MSQDEKRNYLIRYLLDERPEYKDIEIPKDITGRKRLLRALFNVRMPQAVAKKFLQI